MCVCVCGCVQAAMLKSMCLQHARQAFSVAERASTWLCRLPAGCIAGLKAERAQFPEVSRALEKVATERGLQLHQNWLNKCIQLYETYQVGRWR